MNAVLKFIIDFVVLFILIHVVTLLVIRYKKKKKGPQKLKKTDEVSIFAKKYDIDLKEVNYKQLIDRLLLTNTFIISFTSAVIMRIDSIMLSILVAIVIVFILMYLCFGLLAKVTKTKEEKK